MSECRVCSAETSAFLCRPCLGEVERAIGDMPSLLHELSIVATGQANVYRANGKGDDIEAVERWETEQHDIPAWLRSREGRITLPQTRPMIHLGARELMWEIGNTLSTWAMHLAESRGIRPGDEAWPTADDLAPWLLRKVDAIRWDEAADQIHDEVTYVHRQATRAVDRSPSRIYAGPCHAVGEDGRCERDLYAWPGSDEVVCDGHRGDEIGCESVHTAAERLEWLIDSIEDALLPLAQWQQALPRMFPELHWPPRQTWWRWAEPGGRYQRIYAQSRDRVGIDLYRGGDVLDVVRRAQAFLATRGGRRSA